MTSWFGALFADYQVGLPNLRGGKGADEDSRWATKSPFVNLPWMGNGSLDRLFCSCWCSAPSKTPQVTCTGFLLSHPQQLTKTEIRQPSTPTRALFPWPPLQHLAHCPVGLGRSDKKDETVKDYLVPS